MDRFIGVDEIAVWMKVSRPTVRRWFLTGNLAGRLLGGQWSMTEAALAGHLERWAIRPSEMRSA